MAEPRSTCHPITLPPILHSLCINEAGLALEASQVGHQLSFNVGITVDSVVTSIMNNGASTAISDPTGDDTRHYSNTAPMHRIATMTGMTNPLRPLPLPLRRH